MYGEGKKMFKKKFWSDNLERKITSLRFGISIQKKYAFLFRFINTRVKNLLNFAEGLLRENILERIVLMYLYVFCLN